MVMLFYLIFWLLFGFAGVFLSTLCLNRRHRPFGSVLILILCSGGFLFVTIFMGQHFEGFIDALPLIVLGGLGAVLYFRSRQPPNIALEPVASAPSVSNEPGNPKTGGESKSASSGGGSALNR
jgi:hypothetical protein